jgi:hypothetical protein
MKFRVTEIDFDFDDSIGEFPVIEKQEIIDEVLSTTWDADDSEDLVEEITASTGWCVNSIDYIHILS